MKDEIKEILDYLKDENEYYDETEQVTVDYGEIILEKEDIDKLLDYITNLQEENERLKLELSGYREAIFRNDKLLGLQDYKSRCEKAIEYIEKNTIDTTFYIDFDGEIKYVLNLLKGDNK